MTAVAGWALVWLLLFVAIRVLARPRGRRRAVYEIDDPRTGRRFYIGSAFDVHRRMRGHRSGSWWFSRAPLRFRTTLRPDRVTWFDTAAEANRFEAALIRKYQPWANTRGTRHGRKGSRR